MFAISLEPEIETRLELLARKTGRPSSYFIREAVLGYLEDLEDIELAAERLNQPARTWSAEEVKNELGLYNARHHVL